MGWLGKRRNTSADWVQIKRAYCTETISVRAIAKQNSISDNAIIKEARKLGWSRLEEARRSGVGITPDICARILELVGGGQSLRAVCRMAGMPDAKTVRVYRGKDAEFAAAIDMATNQTGASRRLQPLVRRENLRRRFQELFPEIIRRVESGEWFTQVRKSLQIGEGSFIAWRKSNPEIAHALRQARRKRVSLLCSTAKSARRVYQTGVLRERLLEDELYGAAAKAVGRRGASGHEDIVMDLIEACLAGEFAVDEMHLYVDEFSTAHNSRMGTYKAASLDTKITDDSDTAFVDLLTTDDHSYAE